MNEGNTILSQKELKDLALSDMIEVPREKDFVDIIESKMDDFCEHVLDCKYVHHKREFVLNNNVKINNSKIVGKRIDFLITTDLGNVICEVKNPIVNKSHLLNGVSQVLDYIVECEKRGIEIYRSIIVTTKMTDEIGAVIKRFNLPIDVYILTNNYTFEISANK